MKATETRLLDLIKNAAQFVIPIYQRTYSWTQAQCEQLWRDILQAGAAQRQGSHFMGSIVYIEQGIHQVSSHSPLLVIDGQQRLTTVSLLLLALAEYLDTLSEDDSEPVDGFSPQKIRSYYLLNPLEKGQRKYKLLLSKTDSETLIALVDQRELAGLPSVRIQDNLAYFRKQISSQKQALPALCQGLQQLLVVDIALNREHDNPQLIFESMNSTGLDLSQADLIRNYILMGLEADTQTRYYEQYWYPMELEFGQEAYASTFDQFIRDYLTLKTRSIPNLKDIYNAFKAYTRQHLTEGLGIEDILKDLRKFAGYYCRIALGKEPLPALQRALKDLKELRVDVSYPLIMALYDDFQAGYLSAEQLTYLVRLIETYVFRRAVCDIRTNSLNKTFASFSKEIDKDNYVASFEAALLRLPSYRRFPDDKAFKHELMQRNLYELRSCKYFFRRLENAGRKEPVPVDEYTIEHILPQNPELSEAWQAELGANWQDIQATYLHTLGNLTLTAYNAEYSDRPFQQKREMRGGFKESPLRLNEDLRHAEAWNESSIKARAEKLADKALSVWPAPQLKLQTKAPAAAAPDKSAYSLQDYPYLNNPPVWALFEPLQQAVLSLDPCVYQDYLKQYIAFKAETNIVDVVPQAKGLKLYLNLPFQELNDPQDLCRDVSQVGRWSAGPIELLFKDLEQLPYVMGLIRQSYEWQVQLP